MLRAVGSPIGRDGKVPEGYEHWVERWQQRELASGEASRTDVPQLFGSPDTVAKQVQALRDQGVEHIFGRFTIPGVPFERVQRSLELFATEVAPRFRDDEHTPAPVEAATASGG